MSTVSSLHRPRSDSAETRPTSATGDNVSVASTINVPGPPQNTPATQSLVGVPLNTDIAAAMQARLRGPTPPASQADINEGEF